MRRIHLSDFMLILCLFWFLVRARQNMRFEVRRQAPESEPGAVATGSALLQSSSLDDSTRSLPLPVLTSVPYETRCPRLWHIGSPPSARLRGVLAGDRWTVPFARLQRRRTTSHGAGKSR